MNLNQELQRLSDLKLTTEDYGRAYKERNADFKAQQARCLELMEAAGCGAWRNDATGTLYTRVDDRVKGQVEDRRLYIRWCLEQDAAIHELVEWLANCPARSQIEERLFDALFDLELVAVKEKQDRANAQARAHIDDEAPLPPGLTFRPDPYIQQRRS